MRKIDISKQELAKLVYTDELSQREISKIYNCSEACISKKMKELGITKTPEKRWVGKKFGSLLVSGINRYDKHSHAMLDCICECGTECVVVCHSLTSGNTTSCGCTSRKRGSDHKNFKGFEEIQSSHWRQYIKSAEYRNLEFSITMEYAWGIFLSQNRLCALSGKPIYFPQTRKQKTKSTASLDRIDSTIGYIEGNVQWVHKTINRMKWDFDEDIFFDFVKSIAEYKKL